MRGTDDGVKISKHVVNLVTFKCTGKLYMKDVQKCLIH